MMATKRRVERSRDAANLRSASDRERLLRGEQADTAVPLEAARWLAAYRELLEFNRELVEGIERRLASNDLTDHGTEAPDLLLVRAHLQRLEARFQFWERRCLQVMSSR